MAAIEDRQADNAASAGVLPDAPVGLVRLDASARVVAANRAAWDLLALSPEALLGQPCDRLWGLPASVLNDEEGNWCAPGNDPARRIRYHADRDGGGWLLSLPHPETAALLRDAARLAQGEIPAAVTPALRDVAQRLTDAATERALLERIGGLLGGATSISRCRTRRPRIRCRGRSLPASATWPRRSARL